MFVDDATEDHAAEPAIANRQGLFPFHRRPAVPKRKRLVGRLGLAGELAGERGNLVAGIGLGLHGSSGFDGYRGGDQWDAQVHGRVIFRFVLHRAIFARDYSALAED